MAEISQLSSDLLTIQAESILVKGIRDTLREGFSEELSTLRGHVGLITEISIAIESLKHKLSTEEEKTQVFYAAYQGTLGQISADSRMLVQHLRQQQLVYHRTRSGDFVRAVLKLFRA